MVDADAMNEWLKSLGHKDRAEAQKGIAAGRKWGESGQSFDAVKAVVAFAAVSYGQVKDDGLWDGDHDAEYDHRHRLMEEAVGEDDDDFNTLWKRTMGDPFQMGWSFGVGQALMPKWKASRRQSGGKLLRWIGGGFKVTGRLEN